MNSFIVFLCKLLYPFVIINVFVLYLLKFWFCISMVIKKNFIDVINYKLIYLLVHKLVVKIHITYYLKYI